MSDPPARGSSARPSRATRRCVVTGVEALNPRMTRVHLQGDDLVGVQPVGPDQRATLLFPEDGRFTGQADELARARRRRRTYTVLDLDPQAGTAAIDFVLHGDGVAAGWAATAEPGHELDVTGPAGRLHLDPRATSWLLVADETGLPALEAILRWLPDAAQVEAHVEIAGEQERRPLPQRDGMNVVWWSRAHHGTVPGEHVAALGPLLQIGPEAVAWVAAEASAVSALRAHLQGELGLDRRRVSATPYWRAGSTVPSSALRHRPQLD